MTVCVTVCGTDLSYYGNWQLFMMVTLCSATGELPKGLELEGCRGHGFVNIERSHGRKGNATSSAFCSSDVEVSDCL